MEKIGFAGIPLTEFDSDRFALLEPTFHENIGLPERCVIAFYGSLIDGLRQQNRLQKVHELGSIMKPVEIFQLKRYGKDFTVVSPPACGAPLAAAIIEELIAHGCRKFVACGSAGVLDAEISTGTIMVPNAALRDEGTSYHYLPPSRIVRVEPKVVSILEAVLKKNGVNYRSSLSWTTDAPYRETRQKIARRKAEGCLVVEMELAALLAVAHFRKVPLGQYLLAGDDVSGEEWDHRGWSNKPFDYEKIFWLAVEACSEL